MTNYRKTYLIPLLAAFFSTGFIAVSQAESQAADSHTDQSTVTAAGTSISSNTASPISTPSSTQTTKEKVTLTPQWVEAFLHDTNSELLDGSENDQVMSYYYFGEFGDKTLMGLERVRASDYFQLFTIMVFDGETLHGYYHNVYTLPLGLDKEGEIEFPKDYQPTKLPSLGRDYYPDLCILDQTCVSFVFK
ncbi:MAG: hypothetical protein P1U57_05555 [Oleibacter sp.]|nr:hypothetical protein [Thalassolituus sp.]